MSEKIRRQRDEGGFTLIELLIVIIILGILAAIVVFAVGSSRQDAVQNSCKTNLSSVKLGAEAVKTKTGLYPLAVAGTTSAGPTQGELDAMYAKMLDSSAGGTLKNYPQAADYVIGYTPVLTAGVVTDFTATVYPKDSTLTAIANGTVTSDKAAVTNGCAGLS